MATAERVDLGVSNLNRQVLGCVFVHIQHDLSRQEQRASLVGARTLLGALGIASSNKKLLVAPGHTTRSKGSYERNKGTHLSRHAHEDVPLRVGQRHMPLLPIHARIDAETMTLFKFNAIWA